MAPLPAHLRLPLARRFQVTLAGIGDTAGTRMQRQWADLDGYDEDQIDTFTARTAPTLAAAKTAAVRTAAGYYALTARVRPVAIPVDTIPVIADLREPFISTWRAFQAGRPFEEAVAAGAARADAVARNLVTSSARQTGDSVAARANLKIDHWERIPDGDACPWCLEVAPGFYNSAESADFGHDRCGCTADPVYTDA